LTHIIGHCSQVSGGRLLRESFPPGKHFQDNAFVVAGLTGGQGKILRSRCDRHGFLG
jgi:hypothetical protein